MEKYIHHRETRRTSSQEQRIDEDLLLEWLTAAYEADAVVQEELRKGLRVLEEQYADWIKEKEKNTKYYNFFEDPAYVRVRTVDKALDERCDDAAYVLRVVATYCGEDVAERLRETQHTHVWVLELPEGTETMLPKLPPGYLYKGGAARTMLMYALGLKAVPPRDLDIVVEKGVGNSEERAEIARTYMPDDYRNGYGVEELEKNYFDTRDFTVNEVLCTDKKVIATQQCLLDTVRNIVRIADYERKERFRGRGDYYVKPKLLAKALRFLAQWQESGYAATFANAEAVRWIGIDAFHMALHLDRALQSGHAVAQQYVNKLQEMKQIPQDLNTPAKLRKALEAKLSDFVFASETPEQYAAERVLSLWEDYEDEAIGPVRAGMRKTQKKRERKMSRRYF